MIKTPNFLVTFDPLNNPERDTPEYQSTMTRFHKALAQPKPGTINGLRNAITKYPDKPELYNFLYKALILTGQTAEAAEILEKTFQLFPDYLFSKTAKAEQGLQNTHINWVPRYLGEHLHLNKLYPDRTVFHISEVLAYYLPATKFLLETDRIAEASERFEILKLVAPRENQVMLIGRLLVLKQLNASLAKKAVDIAQRDRKIMVTERPLPPQTTVAPEIAVPEMAYFYRVAVEDTSLNAIKKLLKVDRSLIIPELKKVLHDGIDRFNYFFEQEPEYFDPAKEGFMEHALYWVGFLQAEELMEDVLYLLVQDEKVIDYWLGEYLEYVMLPVLVNLGPGHLPALRDIVVMPNLQTESKITIVKAVAQIAMHHEHLKPEVLQWFHGIFDEMLSRADDENLFDSNLMGTIIYQLITLRATEFLPKIKTVFDHDLVPHWYAGDWDAVQKDMAEPWGAWEIKPLPLDIFEYYSGEYEERRVRNSNIDREGLLEETNYNLELLEGLFSELTGLPAIEPQNKRHLNMSPLQKRPEMYNNVGRNEPCPCGSGKKFKRCHGL